MTIPSIDFSLVCKRLAVCDHATDGTKTCSPNPSRRSFAASLAIIALAVAWGFAVNDRADAGDATGNDAAWSSFQNGGHPTIADEALAATLPDQWSPNENIAWEADIEGYGQSTPIVAHGQVFVTSTSGENKDNCHVIAYDIHTGKKNWQFDESNPSPFANTPMVSRAAPTGVATDDGLIAVFEGGVLVSLSPTGTTVWQKDLVALHGKIDARHGLSASLEQDAKRIYVWIERSEQPYVLAIDKKNGEVLWKADGVGKTSWASPRLVPVGNGQHLVCSASGMIIGLDPATGERLWSFDDIANNSSCTPMPIGDGQFLIGASDGRGEESSGDAAASNGLIRITKDSEGSFTAAFRWSANKATSTFGSPVAATNTPSDGGKALFVNRAGVLYQLDLETGEALSVDRTDAGGIWATPLVIGNRAYLFGYKGTTAVIDLSDGKQLHANRCWPAPAEESSFGGGSVLYAASAAPPYLFIRRGDKLYAIKNSEEAAE